MIEIDNESSLLDWLAVGPQRPRAAVQALDLTGHIEFDSEVFPGSLFLACDLTQRAAGNLASHGSIVIPDLGDRPFSIHRSRLYSPEEIFAGFDLDDDASSYQSTFDADVVRHYVATGRQFPSSIAESLARRLHDHSITDALDEAIAGKRVVAIMGGHGVERADPLYATVARISRNLTLEGFLMVSGGGPGAMEATHLGAWMAHFGADQLDAALTMLSARPDGAQPRREYQDADWLHRAFRVRTRWPIGHLVAGARYHSIGVPTWAYGHEPPAPFATDIAKYFANSVREDGLLAIARHGVIFAPGSAGTIQEIFQDAAQNHYASFGSRSPMILLGRSFWTVDRPVWPVLEAVSRGHAHHELLVLTDDHDEVIRRIRDYDPTRYQVDG